MSTAARSTATEAGSSPSSALRLWNCSSTWSSSSPITPGTLAFLRDHLTWTGTSARALRCASSVVVARGVILVATNAVAGRGGIPARLVILTAMAAMLVASLAVPDAFGEYGVALRPSLLRGAALARAPLRTATGRTPETRQPSSGSRRAF
jgi:hypothetical protein